MKSYATFFIIALMTLGLIFSVFTHDRSKKHDAPAEIIEVKETTADAGADAAKTADGAAATPVATDAAAKPAGDKPLRVASLGWELVAAGAAITPAAGGAPAAPAPPIELAPETALDAIEGRLAKGGSDPQGADIAVLPLPAFIASFERLRALEPRAFLIVGFSRGREQIHAAPNAMLKAPPAGDEVKVVGFAPSTSADAAARAAGSESATVLGLFGLDLLGVAPSRVRFVAPGTPEAKAAPFAALLKGTADDRKVAFSTVDASRLIPIVAIAPKALIDQREAVLREWAKAWLDGLSRASKDVPGIARRLAAKEALPLAAGVGGAPEALVLVERLGQIEAATLEQQTSFVGPLAKGPVTLDTLTSRTWTLARGGGLTANAAPEALPIDARIVSMVAPPPKDAPAPPVEGDGGAATFAPLPAGTVPLLAYRAVDGDADKVASQIYFLSGAFERAVFKVTAKGGAKAAIAIATAARDKGVATTRLATAAAEPQGAFAVVEVLTPP
jgi:hypothetical protein